MKNDITISKSILKASIDAQLGKEVELIIPTDYDSTDSLQYDKHLLLLTLQMYLEFSIDWSENIITTSKRSYNIEEFMIKFISNGRKAGYKQERITTL